MARITLHAAAMVLGLFTILAGTVAWREAAVLLTSSRDPALSIPAFLDGTTRPGFSIYSSNLLLDDCLRDMHSVYGRVQPHKRRQAILRHCSNLAMGIVARSPSHAYAWFVGAYAAAAAGETDAFNQRLQMAQAFSPYELWLGELRVRLASSHNGSLNAQSRTNQSSDIRLHLMTDRGAKAITLAMTQDSALKQHVLEEAENLPDNMKWRLVEKLERQMKARQDAQ